LEEGQESKRTLTYRDGWKRSTIGAKPESKAAPSEAAGSSKLWGLVWRRTPLLNVSRSLWVWWSLPAVMFLFFVWMVSQLALLP
jgi:hypothetical protein